MQFQCDRCGKRYSTSQEIREGRSYRFKCRACSNEVIVRGPPTSGPIAPAPKRNGNNGIPRPPEPAHATAAPTPAPQVGASVVQPSDLAPPEGGYVEFRLDDDVVATQTLMAAAPGAAAARDAGAFAPEPRRDPTPPPSPIAQPTPLPLPLEPTPPPESAVALGQEAPPPRDPEATRRRRMILAVAVGSAVAGVALASVVSLGGSARKQDAQAAAAKPPPGLLNPVVYVGPVSFEESRPQLQPSEPAPAAAAPRPPPRRESPSRRAGRESQRAAAREVAAAREPAPVPAPAPAAVPAPAPAPEPARQQPAAPAPALALPLPPPPEPAPQPAPQATPQATAPAAVASAAPAPAPAAPGDEEPRFAREGYRRPVAQTPHCIERSVRITSDLADRLPSSATMRFAVDREGSADLVQVLPGPSMAAGERVDPRVADALRTAVRSCRFVPGADENGRHIRLWVVMQVRFAP